MRLLQALKNQTAASHAGLESSLDVFSRVRTKQDYASLLGKFFTLHEPLEARLGIAQDWPALGWDFEARRKAAWLRNDLNALGVSDAVMTTWNRCDRLPEMDDLGATIGCLYVLEGSTLGGQMISKRFQDTLGITPENGGRFFSGYGSETGTRWRAFGAWAQAVEDKSDGLEASAVKAAQQTFDCFGVWLKF